MNKDRVVIVVEGKRYTFSNAKDNGCESCVIGNNGTECVNKAPCIVNETCRGISGEYQYSCISATKIEPEPKMYFAWNREEARHLVGHKVEYHEGSSDSDWSVSNLLRIDPTGSPFDLQGSYAPMIREIPTIKLTLTELREKYGVPDNVVIVD